MTSFLVILLLLANTLGLRHFLPTSWRTLSVQNSTHTLIAPTDFTPTPTPILSANAISAPAASSAYVIDTVSGEVLYAKNANQTRPIASITKLITTLTILRTHDPAEIVTVPSLPKYGPADDTMGLQAGQRFYLRDLLAASLIKSANDAAEALAIWDAGSLPKFAAKMNTTMEYWDIKDTHFVSASGLVDKDNYASAVAVAKIASIILTNPLVRTLIDTQTKDITSLDGQPFRLQTTINLLQDNRFHGIKTGYTLGAGQSFVGLATINGHPVISVILNSPDRFGETANLINQIQGATRWQPNNFQSSP